MNKKICVIDDDLVTVKIYQDTLEAEGFEVEVIGDGQQALERLKTSRPDLVLLDLMLPKVHGIEVLKFIRAQPATASLPVIVFTNAYLTSMVKAAWNAGANMTLTKANSPPDKLVQAIRTALAAAPPAGPAAALPPSPAPASAPRPTPVSAPPPSPQPATPVAVAPPEPAALPEETPAPEPIAASEEALEENSSPAESDPPQVDPVPPVEMPAFKPPEPPVAPAPATPAPTPAIVPTPPPAPVPTVRRPARMPAAATSSAALSAPAPTSTLASLPAPTLSACLSAAQSLHAEIRQKFLDSAPNISHALRKWPPGSAKNKKLFDWAPLLYELHGIVRPLPGHAGIAKFDTIAQMSSVLEALLEALFEEPEYMNASSFRTVAHAAELLILFFERPVDSQNHTSSNATLLVVDDESTSRQLIRSALELANLKSISVDDPMLALRLLEENPFDLILTDVEMPQMNGFDFCAQARSIPMSKETPVVFITSLSDFDSRARSTISGGIDLIAKPFLLIELSVKALTYVFKNQLQAPQHNTSRF